MTCVQCFLVVSKDCLHCRELLHRAKDAVELLTRRGLLVVNIEDYPAMEHLVEYSVSSGDLRFVIPTPQVVCAVNVNGAWHKVYNYTVKSPEEFHNVRRFLESKIHWLKLQYGKLCFETRGRKQKSEAAASSTAKRSSRKKRGTAEGEA